jgi:hypothetical protein
MHSIMRLSSETCESPLVGYVDLCYSRIKISHKTYFLFKMPSLIHGMKCEYNREVYYVLAKNRHVKNLHN